MKRPSAAVQKRQTAVLILSLVVVASMVCSFVVMVRPPSAPATQPTPLAPAPSPTLRPTSAPNAQPATSAPPIRLADPTATSVVSVTNTLGLTPTAATPVAMRGLRDFTFAVCGDNRDGPQIYGQVLDSVQRDRPAFNHYVRIVVKGEEFSTEVIKIAA